MPSVNTETRVRQALAECVGAIDTFSLTESFERPYLDPSPVEPVSYPMASDEPPTANEEFSTEPATRTLRGRAIPPLDEIASGMPESAPSTRLEKLRTPRVVQQILEEMGENWVALAKAIESRVHDAEMRTLLVTEALRGEGATTVACALAISLAQHTKLKVLLLDANFAHPAVARTFQLATRLGIEHHLLESVSLSEVIVESARPPMAILPAIEAFELPSMVMGSEKIETVLARLKSTYDLIVIDGGALFAGRKPITLPQGVDATLIVRDPSKSSPELLDQLDAYLARTGVSSLGVIENGIE